MGAPLQICNGRGSRKLSEMATADRDCLTATADRRPTTADCDRGIRLACREVEE